MGDGRCLTSFDSARITNDAVMMMNGIQYADNYSYRQLLQKGGVQALGLPLRNGACGAPVPDGTWTLREGNLNLK
jgi:hypothetical protein